MKSKFAFSLLFGCAVSAVFACSSSAATYTETGDAGDLPSSAQTVFGTAGTPLTSISGSLTLTNGTSDSDMYQIFISNPAAFSASVTAFVAGANNFDSQLMLFNSAGVGVEDDDDDTTSGAPQSTLPAGTSTTNPKAAGLYYLLISGSGRYATSTLGLISPNFTDGTTDPTVVQGPTGAGGAAPINGYTGTSNEAGNYVITINGAQFVPAAVPEPGATTAVLLGLAGLGFLVRMRRSAAK